MKEKQFDQIKKLFEGKPELGVPVIFISDEEYDLESLEAIPFRESAPIFGILFARNTRTDKVEGIGITFLSSMAQSDVDNFAYLLAGLLPWAKKFGVEGIEDNK